MLTDNLLSQSPLEGERERNFLNQTGSKELSSMVDMVDQHRVDSFLCSQMDLENKPAPLYQRVLSALIIEDQTEETVGDGNISFPYERDDSPSETCYSFENQMCLEDNLLLELRSVGLLLVNS